LRQLRMRELEEFGPGGLEASAACAARLRLLDVRHCGGLLGPLLPLRLSALTSLRTLRVAGAQLATLSFLCSMSHLATLDLSECHLLLDASVDSFAPFASLRVLERLCLDRFRYLSTEVLPILFALPSLLCLSMAHCHGPHLACLSTIAELNTSSTLHVLTQTSSNYHAM